MRAARVHGPRDIRIESVPDPEPGPDEVLLRPLFTGLCGSDLHVWHAGAPLIPGHEFSAEVIGVGAGVETLRPGALVTVEPMWTCGACPPCRRGAYNLCRRMRWHGLSEKTGALAERTVVRERMVHALPDGVDARQGALVEPLAVAHHAVGRAAVPPGGSALVLGAGPIGVACALDLLARGVRRVVVSEPSPRRRAAATAALAAAGTGTTAAESGVVVVDPGTDDVLDVVGSRTAGEGVDAVLDAAGVPAAFALALAAVRPGGRVVTVAVYLEPVTFHPLTTFLGEVDLVASCGYRDDFPAVLDLLGDGRFPLDDHVRTVPLDAVADAFADLEAGRTLKVLVEP